MLDYCPVFVKKANQNWRNCLTEKTLQDRGIEAAKETDLLGHPVNPD